MKLTKIENIDDADGTRAESESGDINGICLNKNCTPSRLRRSGRDNNVSSGDLTERVVA